MIEYQVVDHPAVFPQQCICGSQTGPTLDTFIEKAGLRIYVCKLCAQRISAAFGFAKGEELDRLMDSRRLLDQARVEMEARDRRALEQEGEINRLKALNVELEDERDHALGEAAQLRHIAAAIDAQAKELVGPRGGAA